LKDFAGKKVVLYFYPKDNTPGCTQEACDFRDNMARVQAAGAVVLGVSGDSIASHERFRDKYELPFPLLSDESHEMMEKYGVWQEKKNYGRTYMGVVRSTVLIDENGVIRRIWPKVTVKGHVDAVLSALAED
jgi:peroxiredoxin Q/BCP